jgi:hypothetical protein
MSKRVAFLVAAMMALASFGWQPVAVANCVNCTIQQGCSDILIYQGADRCVIVYHQGEPWCTMEGFCNDTEEEELTLADLGAAGTVVSENSVVAEDGTRVARSCRRYIVAHATPTPEYQKVIGVL